MKSSLIFSACVAAVFSCNAAAQAQTSATPSPSATPAASAISDPCSSVLSIVNRPTIGTGVCTVRAHHAMIETGWMNTVTTGAGGGNTSAWGASLLRFGTGDPHLDVEIAPPNIAASSLGGARVSGTTDASLVLKRELGYNSRSLWGANVQVTLPTGSAAFTSGGTQYTANFNWGTSLSSIFGASGTLGFNEFRASGISYFAFVPTLELTAALPQSSQLFAEYAYFSQAGPGAGGKSFIDYGYQRQLGSHAVFDVEFGEQPSPIGGQRQHYFGAGLSFMN